MNRESCSYPDNSSPACTPQNPCAFYCEPPFVAKGNQCVCQAPYRLCNGVCGMFSYVSITMPSFSLYPNAYNRVCFYQGCGSAAPHPYKRLSPEIKARSHGIFSNEDAKATCRHDERVCGVYDGSDAFECLNTDIALESCKCQPQRINIFNLISTRMLFQVAGACHRTHSSTIPNRALRASTARPSRTSSTFAALAATVLSTAARKVSSRLPIVRNASVSMISSQQGNIRYKPHR